MKWRLINQSVYKLPLKSLGLVRCFNVFVRGLLCSQDCVYLIKNKTQQYYQLVFEFKTFCVFSQCHVILQKSF